MEIKDLQNQLEGLKSTLETHFKKAEEQQAATGTMTAELKEQITKVQAQADEIDKKIVDRIAAPVEHKTLADSLKENDDVARLIRDKKGRAMITFKGNQAAQLWDRKTTITTPTVITPAPVDAERMSGIVTEARRVHTVRSVLSARPTSAPLVYWVKVNSPLTAASPQQGEGHTKKENAVTFTTANSPVKTLATFIKASRQALDDFGELAGFLQSSLPYYVNRTEETQLLSGTGSGEDLNGLITQASSFDTGLLAAGPGWTRIDQIGEAIDQIGIADEIDPTFIILNKQDWWKIRRTKDSFGRYLMGDPQSTGNPTIWDLTPVPTNSIAQGTFLVGSGESAAAEIRDRMEMEVEISTQDEDNFQKNLVTVRAEKRLVLCVMRPGSFVTGTFSTSPSGG
jgi:HK97 family phage major capsid protein